jgi:hypothetical protein
MGGFECAVPLKYYRLFYRIKLYLEGFFCFFTFIRTTRF